MHGLPTSSKCWSEAEGRAVIEAWRRSGEPERAGEAFQGHGVGRRQRNQERAKRKRAAFYAESRAESAKIDAAIAAETKDAERSASTGD